MEISLTLAALIGVLTVIFSILTKVIGIPDQISKNHKRRSTEGVSASFFVLLLVSYVLWTLHGILRKDWVIILGHGLGVVTTGAVVLQILYYKKTRADEKTL